MQMELKDLVGVGGPLATLYGVVEVLKHFGYKKAKNGGGFAATDKVTLSEIKSMTTDLKDMHDVRDVDGRPIWYSQRREIEQLANEVRENTGVMRALPAQIAQAIRDTNG